MAIREVAASLDEDLIERMDALAEVEGTTRSELLRRAVQVVIRADDTLAANEEFREAYNKRRRYYRERWEFRNERGTTRHTPQDPLLFETARDLALETTPFP